MANTRDVIGEKATLAGIVGNTLTSLEDDGVTTIGSYALQYRTALAGIKFPNATTIGGSAFAYCTELTEIGAYDLPNATYVNQNAFDSCQNLTSVRLPSATTISTLAFNGCSKLRHLILESSSVVSIYSDTLQGTLIGGGDGGVYVPANLVATYKADANWSMYNIFPISEYPRSSFDTISDSWDTIISYANAGTIGNHYVVGDTKKVTIDGIDYYAQLAGINKDTLSSDGTTKANSTWLLKTVLSISSGAGNSKRMNESNTTVGGWAETEMRNTTLPAIFQTFPANLQSAIKSVNKVSYRFEDTSEQITADKLWIPSSQEVNPTSNLKETTGVTYDGVFTNNNASRKRTYNNGGRSNWWLRSACTADSFGLVSANGGVDYINANRTQGVILGFCI